MALGGRPKDGPGHRPLNITVRKDIYEELKKVPNKSRFIEDAIRPILQKYDPGSPCKYIKEYHDKGVKLALEALYRGDYDELMAYASALERFKDLKNLCQIEFDRETCEKIGGEWVEDRCTLPGPKRLKEALLL